MFRGDFDSVSSIESAFEEDGALKDSEVLFAWYGIQPYEGTAFVLFKRDGEIYEVHGSHCSCNGLENQWQPEKTSKQSLMFRIEKGRLGDFSYYGENFGPELKTILEKEE